MREILLIIGIVLFGCYVFIWGIWNVAKLANPHVCVYVSGENVWNGNKAYIETKSLGNQTQIKIRSGMIALDKMYTSDDIVVTTECK